MRLRITPILIILSAIVAMACDTPRSGRRDARNAREAEPATFNPRVDDQFNSNQAVAPSSIIPTDVQHCSFSSDGINGYANISSHIGAYTLCQSSCVQNLVRIQVRDPQDSQICLIPTHNAGNGQSIYIGEPRCLTINNNQTIYTVQLLNNRAGFSNFPINGAMIIKDRSYFFNSPYNIEMRAPDAYLFCALQLDVNGDARYCQTFAAQGHFQSAIFSTPATCTNSN